MKREIDTNPRATLVRETYANLYHRRRRLMHWFRRRDFGRYKKIMTYLGLRDRFNQSLLTPGVHLWEHVHSHKKPPGGRRPHI